MFGNLNELPKPIGDYIVGITQIDTRFKTQNGREKVVPALVYYPADDNNGREPTPYASAKELHTLNKSLFFLTRRLSKLKTHCFQDIPISTNETDYPIVFYSPGAGTFIMQSTTLCCDLASKGYVVIAVGHPSYLGDLRLENGAFINEYAEFDQFFRNGIKSIIKVVRKHKLLKKDRMLSDAEFDALAQTLYVEDMKGTYINQCAIRASENLQNILDKVEQINAGEVESQFEGKFRLSLGVGVTGHSLGGATAAQFCKDDERAVCGINMDGIIFGEDPFMDVAKPFLFMGTRLAWNLARQLYTNNSAESYFVEIAETAHFGYTDLLFGARQVNLLRVLGKRDMYDFRRVITDFHLGFFDKYLLKMELDFEDHNFEDVTVRGK
ncbi:MAG: hypothetical protein AAF902_00605 [Chloroflexota bacterium]